jgi:hypothetical protein
MAKAWTMEMLLVSEVGITVGHDLGICDGKAVCLE